MTGCNPGSGDKGVGRVRQGLVPRRAALQMLDGVVGKGRLLAELTEEKGLLARLAPADRARATRLATETLRQFDRADRLLGAFLRKRPALAVHNALRLGVVEICALGEAPHGVVNALVQIMREGKHTGPAAGLVNAVLRRVLPEVWQALPPSRLPKWLRKPLIATYGKARITAMEEVHAGVPPLDLTPRDGEAAALAARLGGQVLPTGSVRLSGVGQVSALPGYDRGAWWVQDAAAALPARILAPVPGERVLDICAAPGGKTMQLAAAGAEVTAIDISPARMERLAENLSRTGLSVRCEVANMLHWHDAPYDAILLDAPCSATGTIRRHPDLPHVKNGSDFPALFKLQARMIDHALTLLKPGGRLVFCTCSLLPEEGEIQIAEACERHPGLRVDNDAVMACAGVGESWCAKGGGLRLTPDIWADRGGIDGFFIAALRKTQQAAPGSPVRRNAR